MAMWQILLIILLLAPISLLAGALWRNRVPLTQPPGLVTRLKTYFGHNVATLQPGSRFPELRPAVYPFKPALLCSEIPQALAALGWDWQDSGDCHYRATVTTALLGFTDDVSITVEAVGEASSLLKVRSASRFGKGDLGANTRHILDFVAAIDRQFAEGRPVPAGVE